MSNRLRLPRLHLTKDQFLALPEYSASYPTGTTPGKRWRRHDGAHDPRRWLPKDDPRRVTARWFILEYGDISGDGKTIAVKWFHPVIRLDSGTLSIREMLADRIDRAIKALLSCPDIVDPAKATRGEMAAVHDANLRAYAILAEGRDPPPQRSHVVQAK